MNWQAAFLRCLSRLTAKNTFCLHCGMAVVIVFQHKYILDEEAIHSKERARVHHLYALVYTIAIITNACICVDYII